ncbi:Hypothetical protein PBC10988_1230 [Planctomycetales bacterium 10988]|nr:Hypothetical protein PBC10988_1230 [Planctomycetales bacterium 10988]
MKLLRILTVILACMILLLCGSLIGAYSASQVEPEFYQQVIQEDPIKLEEAGDELEAKTSALASLTDRPGTWQASFTQRQINGWLASDLPEKHPDLLPKNIQDPRVVLAPDVVKVACRMEQNGVSSVIWLESEVFLTDERELAIRIRSLKAGALPMPTSVLLEQLDQEFEKLSVSIRRIQSEGKQTLLIKLPRAKEGVFSREIGQLEVREEEVFIAGKTTDENQETTDPTE